MMPRKPDRPGPNVARRLFFFWVAPGTGESSIPSWMAESIASWRAHHPGFSVTVIDDRCAIDLLAGRHPELGRLYSRIRIPACKADLARIACLHAFGGIYVDGHTACTGSLEPLLQASRQHDVVLPLHPDHLATPHSFPHPLRTGVMIARSGAKLLDALLREATVDLAALEQRQHRGGPCSYNISELTGPRFVARKLRGGLPEPVSVGDAPDAHCEGCAMLEASMREFNTMLVDLEGLVQWHRFSDYRMTPDQRFRDTHWSVLQTRIRLFETTAAARLGISGDEA